MSRGAGLTDAQTKTNCHLARRASCRGSPARLPSWRDGFRQDWPAKRCARRDGYYSCHPGYSWVLCVTTSCNGCVGQQSEVALPWSRSHCLYRTRPFYCPIQVRLKPSGSSANPAIPHRGQLYCLRLRIRWELVLREVAGGPGLAFGTRDGRMIWGYISMTQSAVCTSTSSFSRCHSTGKERDAESGLDYFGARYYASNMGRWMSPDWAASVSPVPWANLADPQTLNLYEYVRNNPLSLVDDDGHNWFTQFAQGLADSTYRPLVQIAEHPIATAQGIGTAIEHPIVTGKAIGSAVAGTVEAAAHGDGRAIGQIVGTVGTAIAGGAALRGVGVAGEVGAEAGSFVGESTSVTTTELYRAVDATELQSIQSTGSFLPSPNGTEYKGFFFSQESAEQFGAQQAAGGGPSTTVVRGTAPTDLVNSSPVHSAATEGRGVLIHNDNLPQVKPQ